MVEVSLAVFWGMGAVFTALIWWRLERNALILKHELTAAARAVESATPTDFNIQDLKAELEELIAETIGSMSPPSIADHLGGVLAQWAQIKMMREAQNLNGPPIIGEPTVD